MTDRRDADIAAMSLTEEEKEGLQLYRNYSDAFEKHAIKLFVAEVNGRSIDLSPLDGILSHLCREDVRFLPVLASAFADEQLEKMFRDEIPDGVPGGKSALLGSLGPLSRFSHRIQVAFAFGWCNRDLLLELNKLRKLRNDISHSWDIAKIQPKVEEFISRRMHKIEADLVGGMESLPAEWAALHAHGLFRLRLIWLMGRTFYECCLYVSALSARITPNLALYGSAKPDLLGTISAKCRDATNSIGRATAA